MQEPPNLPPRMTVVVSGRNVLNMLEKSSDDMQLKNQEKSGVPKGAIHNGGSFRTVVIFLWLHRD